MYQHGYHDLGPDMHVPTPGRVQYYRAEALPFVPAEIKTQLRFPKAYAQSEINLRYLEKVKDITQSFINKKIDQNYFTGESSVPMTATLGEVEVLNSAGDAVKSMAQSGGLADIHSRCDTLKEASESQYINLRDRIENVIQTLQTKEDDIYSALIAGGVAGIKTHEDSNSSILNIASTIDGMASVSNLAILDSHISKTEDKASLQDAHNKLVALLSAKTNALESLIKLQQAYCDHVEPGDAASINDLGNFNKKHERFSATLASHGSHSDSSSGLFDSQIRELSGDIDSVSAVFADFAAATAERVAIFSNFSGK